jgi:hypothetical protein
MIEMGLIRPLMGVTQGLVVTWVMNRAGGLQHCSTTPLTGIIFQLIYRVGRNYQAVYNYFVAALNQEQWRIRKLLRSIKRQKLQEKKSPSARHQNK